MKIRSAERLLLVAIVTSAVVAQVRVHTLPSGQTAASGQTQAAQHKYTGHTRACDDEHNGMLRTACDSRRDPRSADGYSRSIDRMNVARTSKLRV
jgi:hypothetical protein